MKLIMSAEVPECQKKVRISNGNNLGETNILNGYKQRLVGQVLNQFLLKKIIV